MVADCVVTSKDIRTIVVDGDSRTGFLVGTENCVMLGIQDNMLFGQFNSSEMYGQIKVGGTYSFETRGDRLAVIDNFPNIQRIIK